MYCGFEPYQIDPYRILTIPEYHLMFKFYAGSRRRVDTINEMIFRLSACCGLRCKEIQGLEMRDIILSGVPHIFIRPEITKKPSNPDSKARWRRVPLHWDPENLEWFTRFMTDFSMLPKNHRVVYSTYVTKLGNPLERKMIASRWNNNLRSALGPERADLLSIHKGRHSFVSHALAAGRSVVEVRDAAGHKSIDVTNIYARAVTTIARPLFSHEDADAIYTEKQRKGYVKTSDGFFCVE